MIAIEIHSHLRNVIELVLIPPLGPIDESLPVARPVVLCSARQCPWDEMKFIRPHTR